MDWRKDQRDGQFKIMDCNPRVGMNFRMFENSAGIDVVRAQHLDLTGRIVDRSRMVERKRFVVETYYLLSLIRGGRPALPRGLEQGPRPHVREHAWWSSDDALPFLVMSVRLLAQTTWHMLRNIWSHWFVQGLRKRMSLFRQ
jgi:hypothetical protein